MGGDGGSIANTRKYLGSAKKDDVDFDAKDDRRVLDATTCAYSGRPLEMPVVCCDLGLLYSKEALLEALITKKDLSSSRAAHLRSSKDVYALDLTPNPESPSSSNFVCPITGDEMNGVTRFFAVVKERKAYSNRAIKEMPSLSKEGLVIELFPSEENRKIMADEMLERRATAKKTRRKNKKKKTRDGESLKKKRKVETV